MSVCNNKIFVYILFVFINLNKKIIEVKILTIICTTEKIQKLLCCTLHTKKQLNISYDIDKKSY